MKKLILLIAVSAFSFVWACDAPNGGGCDSDSPTTPSAELTVTGPISSDIGKGAPWMTAWIDLSARGYVEEEFLFEGTATSYQVDGTKASDGKWSVAEGEKAPFKTRLLVRRPEDPEKFNGTVIVEWFNVSGGVDAAPGWMFNQPMLIREGFAWVGVSAQKVGIQGGMSMLGNLVQPLVTYDPERYGSLTHPGDAYSYDIFTTAAKLIKGQGPKEVLGGLTAERVLAYGESQSAGTMITYTNAVQPLAKVFDGIFIHSRGSAGHPLGDDQDGGGGCGASGGEGGGLKVRTDLDVPVFQFETETDVASMGFYKARQPDTDLIRTWEVAGTAHADFYLINYINTAEVKENVPEGADMFSCDNANKGPQYIVLRAALKGLDQWVKEGIAPPKADPLKMNGAQLARDEHGNAEGGIRTPLVDVPIATLKPTGGLRDGGQTGGCSGGEEEGGCAGSAMLCGIFGATVPFTEEVLLELYPTHEEYVAKFKASAETTVANGFMLEEEAAAIIAEAEAAPIPN